MRLSFQLLILLSSWSLLVSCDTISDPIENAPVQVPDTLDRAIVLEDFTGQTCANCPDATKEALRLKSIYGDRLIIMLPHVGFFASPSTGFPANFRTPEGDQLDQFFGIDGALPSGLVNRRRTNNAWKLNYLNWSSAVQVAAQLKSPFVLNFTHTYDSSSRQIQLNATVQVISVPTNVQHNIAVYILEDSILSPQLHKAPVGIVEDYIHNNMLRGSFNGAYGESLGNPPYTLGSTINKQWTYTLNSQWKDKQVSLVVFVAQNTSSSREIMQARKVKLIPLLE